MKITRKHYRCPVCDEVHQTETNHYGPIYSRCKKCKNTGMICIEDKAIQARAEIDTIPTKIHHYSFDISQEVEANAYLTLVGKLKFMGLSKFASIDMGHPRLMVKIKSMHDQPVDLMTHFITDNQWITQPGLRLFDWYEPIFPHNRKLRKGYWLDQTPAMDLLRIQHLKCGYCGTIKNYNEPFCSKHPDCRQYGMKPLITEARKRAVARNSN